MATEHELLINTVVHGCCVCLILYLNARCNVVFFNPMCCYVYGVRFLINREWWALSYRRYSRVNDRPPPGMYTLHTVGKIGSNSSPMRNFHFVRVYYHTFSPVVDQSHFFMLKYIEI